MNKIDHWFESKLILIAILIIMIFNGIAFYLLTKQNKTIFNELGKESIGTFLITKFNEKEKSCPGVIMANGEKVYVGAVAISPDIRNSGLLMFGDKIQIDGYGEYRVSCLTHRRRKRTIDIYVSDVNEAKTHGAKRKRVYLILKNYDTQRDKK